MAARSENPPLPPPPGLLGAVAGPPPAEPLAEGPWLPAPPEPPAAKVPPRPTTVPSALVVVASEPGPLLPPAPAVSLLSPPAPPPPPTARSSVVVGNVSNTNEPPPPPPPTPGPGLGGPAAPPPPNPPPLLVAAVPTTTENVSPHSAGTVAIIWPPAPPTPPAADEAPDPPAMATVTDETPAGTLHCWTDPAGTNSTVHVVASHDGVGSADATEGWMTPVANTPTTAVTTITASTPRLIRRGRTTTCTCGSPSNSGHQGTPEVANTLRPSGEETVDADVVRTGRSRTRHKGTRHPPRAFRPSSAGIQRGRLG